MRSQSFSSLGSFSRHLAQLAVAEPLALRAGLEKAAAHVNLVAKGEIGHYQPETGPFPAWAPLADATEADKARKGYPLNSPLLREGDLQNSYTHEVHGLEAIVGSTDPVAVYQELGTETIPPRPVLGPAVIRSHDYIVKVMGEAAVVGLLGGQIMADRVGYKPAYLK